MINLPKPSLLQINGNTQDQIVYIVRYLKTLVSALEKYLGGLNGNTSTTETGAITNFAYTSKGVVIVRNDGSEQTIEGNQLLWSGAKDMRETHSITLSSKVSEQMSGIVLVFSGYDWDENEPVNYHFAEFFVPKKSVSKHSGNGRIFTMATGNFTWIGSKYLYISDDTITGFETNDDTGTANGVTYDNKHWVLRYVIGV